MNHPPPPIILFPQIGTSDQYNNAFEFQHPGGSRRVTVGDLVREFPLGPAYHFDVLIRRNGIAAFESVHALDLSSPVPITPDGIVTCRVFTLGCAPRYASGGAGKMLDAGCGGGVGRGGNTATGSSRQSASGGKTVRYVCTSFQTPRCLSLHPLRGFEYFGAWCSEHVILWLPETLTHERRRRWRWRRRLGTMITIRPFCKLVSSIWHFHQANCSRDMSVVVVSVSNVVRSNFGCVANRCGRARRERSEGADQERWEGDEGTARLRGSSDAADERVSFSRVDDRGVQSADRQGDGRRGCVTCVALRGDLVGFIVAASKIHPVSSHRLPVWGSKRFCFLSLQTRLVFIFLHTVVGRVILCSGEYE